MKYKIGVISDTHGLLREEVIEYLTGCNMIFHAGDIDHISVLTKLQQIAPVRAVRGNVDGNWAAQIPETEDIRGIGINVFMIHDKKKIHADLRPYDLIIYGHSHIYKEERIGGKVWLNPGSCGPRRFRTQTTMAMLCIEDDCSFHIERINLLEAVKTESQISSEMIQIYLPAIMKDIEKGQTVGQIARKYHIPVELSEKICRLYVTHPGVTVDGIMTRMGF